MAELAYFDFKSNSPEISSKIPFDNPEHEWAVLSWAAFRTALLLSQAQLERRSVFLKRVQGERHSQKMASAILALIFVSFWTWFFFLIPYFSINLELFLVSQTLIEYFLLWLEQINYHARQKYLYKNSYIDTKERWTELRSFSRERERERALFYKMWALSGARSLFW